MASLLLITLAAPFARATAQSVPVRPASELVILDTDIGDDIDDAFALSLALASPEFQILGITTAWGDTSLRSRLVDRLLCETGRDQIPVLTGIPTHRAGAAAFSQEPWADAGPKHPHPEAIGFLLDQIRRHPGQITLITIAPLTNIGAAIDRDPATFRKLKRVVLMGGSIDRGYGGYAADAQPSSTPSAEYNIAMDPAAASKLFHSGVPIVMLPLDSTQLKLGSQAAQLASISTPLTDALQVLINEWSRTTHQTIPTLFDPVAVAYVIDPTTCPTKDVSIAVDDQGFTRSTPITTSHPANAAACLSPHPELFFPLLMPRLLNQHLAGTRTCIAPIGTQASR